MDTLPALLHKHATAQTTAFAPGIRYAQLHDDILSAAKGLRALGITHRDTVGNGTQKIFHATLADLAVAHAGAATISLDRSREQDLSTLWRHGCAAVFTSTDAHTRELRGIAKTTISFDTATRTDLRAGVWRYEDLLSLGRERTLDARPGPSDLAAFVPASRGDTMHTHHSICAAVEALRASIPLCSSDRLLLALDPHEPLCRAATYLALSSGAQVHESDAPRFEEDLSRVRPTAAIAGSTAWLSLAGKTALQRTLRECALLHAECARDATDARGIRRAILTATAGLTYPLLQLASAFRALPTYASCGGQLRHSITTERFPLAAAYLAQGIAIRRHFTLPEAFGTIAQGDAGRADTLTGSILSAVIATETGGALYVRGPQFSRGYRNDPLRTACALSNGYETGLRADSMLRQR